MPKPVKQVPNTWLPYMDGQIWEFTTEEYEEMYPNFSPMRDEIREMVGVQMIQWARKGHVYVRFYRPEDARINGGVNWVEWLAGWVGNQSDTPSEEWYEINRAQIAEKFDVG